MIQKVIELIEQGKSHYFLQDNDTFKSVKFDSEIHKVSGRILLTNEFHNIDLNLPDISDAQLKKAIPFMIKDELIEGDSEDEWIQSKDSKEILAASSEYLNSVRDLAFQENLDFLTPFHAYDSEVNTLIFFENFVYVHSKRNKIRLMMSLATFKLSKENIINQFKADPLEVFSVEEISLDKDLKIQSKVFDSYEDLMIHSFKSIDFSYFNLMQGRYEKRLDIDKLFKQSKKPLIALASIYLFFISLSLIEIISYSFQIDNSLEKSKQVFNQKFPSLNYETDFNEIKYRLMRQNNDQDQLKLISTVSNAVTSLNSTNLNSFVLSQQRTAFEVEANSFADLERIIAKLEGEGIYAQIGTSNRSNNFIIGEIIIESF